MDRCKGQEGPSPRDELNLPLFGTLRAPLKDVWGAWQSRGDAMKIRRKKLPLIPARTPERGRELELEMPVPPLPEPPGLKRQDEPSERGELVIDMFGTDDTFTI